MEPSNSQPKLERLSYFKQALSNITHTREVLTEAGLLDGDLRLQFLSLERNINNKIKTLEIDISNGIIF